LRSKSLIAGVFVAFLGASACRQDMQNQPKYKPLAESRFYASGRSSRPIPAGTVARDELNDDDAFHTGEADGAFLDTIPMAVNLQVLQRGRDRYNIFCTPCHGLLGYGDGMVARRGLRAPANFHTERLRHVPPGYIFRVITNGYGGMGDYRDQIPVRDRWTIVAYLRALQLSRDATLADVPAADRSKLEAPGPKGVAP
jgi:hypothetical protein